MELAILTVASITNILVGIFILFNNPKSYTNRFFFAFTLFAAIWAVINYFSLRQITPQDSLNMIRWVMFFAVLHSVSLFLMIHTFPEEKIRLGKAKLILVLLFCLVILILTRTPLIFASVTGFGTNAHPNPGSAIPLFALFTGFSIGGAIYLLISRYRRASGVLKAQLRYLLFGVTGSALLIFLSNFVLVVLFKTTILLNLGPTFTLIFIVATAYAITKHGLFNTKVILAEISGAALVLVNITQLFFARSTAELLFRLAIFVLVTFFAYIFVRSVQNEVKRREEVEGLAKEKTLALQELEKRNKNLATLQRISDIVLNQNDMKPMTQQILDELPNQLENCAGAFLAIVENGKLVPYLFSDTNFSKKITTLVGQDVAKYQEPIEGSYSAINTALSTKKMVESDNLSDFISPPLPKTVVANIQRSINAQHVEALPLYAGGEPLGVMTFIYTAPKEQIHEKNFDVAKAIADDMSLAIQRAQAFQQLKDANEYLDQLDKMKDEFISMASHELNTPLAAIEGYLSMILDEGMGKIDAQSREYLNRAYASSKRLAELILDLLNVSRIEQGRLKMKFSEVNLAELAQSVIHELQIKADAKKIYLKLEADTAKIPAIWCDPERIREVFVNLTGNALKFTDKGGVTLRVIAGGAGTIRCEVTDTGRGIAKEDQTKLFQKFSQVKREVDEHQGTGLGLYISKNFVDLHKGKLWVESEAGQGATFIFELPALKEAPKEVEGAILERPMNAPSIEVGNTKAPDIVTNSSKPPAPVPPTAPGTGEVNKNIPAHLAQPAAPTKKAPQAAQANIVTSSVKK